MIYLMHVRGTQVMAAAEWPRRDEVLRAAEAGRHLSTMAFSEKGPKCQAAARAEWLDERTADLPPVEYFHAVFTLPGDLGPLALQNQRLVDGALFQAAAQSLVQLALDLRHLGADIGFLAVLHTWGQNLHPHVHCVVPGGGVCPGGNRWVSCRPGFFLPMRLLGRLFRKKLLDMLSRAYDRGPPVFHGQQQRLAHPRALRQVLEARRQKEWVVYAKPPLGGPEQVLKYLAGYTHWVAISNARLVKLEDGRVYFRWKEYADGNAQKVMALGAVEFIRRFLLHVVPSGFVRIRHHGLLANRWRAGNVARCRALLGVGQGNGAGCLAAAQGPQAGKQAQVQTPAPCPVCGQGNMVVVAKLEPVRAGASPAGVPTVAAADTSWAAGGAAWVRRQRLAEVVEGVEGSPRPIQPP